MQSKIISILTQADGRAYVRERHTDSHGIAHEVEYLAAPGTDHEAVMAARAPQIEADLRQQELDSIEAMVLSGIPAIAVAPPKYVTPDEAYAYLFQRLITEKDMMKLLKAAQFIDLFSDAEMVGYGMSAELIATVRTKAAEIKAVAAQVDAYLPPVGGV